MRSCSSLSSAAVRLLAIYLNINILILSSGETGIRVNLVIRLGHPGIHLFHPLTSITDQQHTDDTKPLFFLDFFLEAGQNFRNDRSRARPRSFFWATVLFFLIPISVLISAIGF